jgi:hypothetical protein
LCRNEISLELYIKLRVDFDPAEDANSDERKAREIQASLAQLANQGTTETKLKETLARGRDFVSKHSRNKVSTKRRLFCLTTHTRVSVHSH